ncbi:MAG TPA: hypothetical protein PKN54_00725 [Candidatus Cloacimonas acidaminovorans]|nr:hypothetical protein [Candidatus Cloacimonas acidaminovorans]
MPKKFIIGDLVKLIEPHLFYDNNFIGELTGSDSYIFKVVDTFVCSDNNRIYVEHNGFIFKNNDFGWNEERFYLYKRTKPLDLLNNFIKEKYESKRKKV